MRLSLAFEEISGERLDRYDLGGEDHPICYNHREVLEEVSELGSSLERG